ncbi:MAG: sulfur transferase domain-containing protein [Pseudomonadota bacterium]
MKKLIILLAFFGSTCLAEPPAPDTLKVQIADVIAADSVTPVDGITVSGQPNEEALAVFAASGYTTVIDLRGARENRGIDEDAAVAAAGMDYVQLPIESAAQINYATAAELTRLIDASEGPVLLHCGSGNRVGALLALAKRQEGASVEDSITYGTRGGLTRLRGVVEERLQAPPSEESSP